MYCRAVKRNRSVSLMSGMIDIKIYYGGVILPRHFISRVLGKFLSRAGNAGQDAGVLLCGE